MLRLLWFEALKKTSGDTNTNKLIASMEGMSFDTPKGKNELSARKIIRPCRICIISELRNDPAFAWGVPELVRVDSCI